MKSKRLNVKIFIIMIFILLLGCSDSHINVGPILEEMYKNGVYEGKYLQFPNRVVVKVSVKDNKIVNIQLVSHFASWIGKKAEQPVIKEIIEKQSTKVDAVTGATNSSEAIMKAVQSALKKAETGKN